MRKQFRPRRAVLATVAPERAAADANRSCALGLSAELVIDLIECGKELIAT
jgi:hypothetical protein